MGNMHNMFLCNMYNMSLNICLILGVFLVVLFCTFWYYILVTKKNTSKKKGKKR